MVWLGSKRGAAKRSYQENDTEEDYEEEEPEQDDEDEEEEDWSAYERDVLQSPHQTETASRMNFAFKLEFFPGAEFGDIGQYMSEEIKINQDASMVLDGARMGRNVIFDSDDMKCFHVEEEPPMSETGSAAAAASPSPPADHNFSPVAEFQAGDLLAAAHRLDAAGRSEASASARGGMI